MDRPLKSDPESPKVLKPKRRAGSMSGSTSGSMSGYDEAAGPSFKKSRSSESTGTSTTELYSGVPQPTAVPVVIPTTASKYSTEKQSSKPETKSPLQANEDPENTSGDENDDSANESVDDSPNDLANSPAERIHDCWPARKCVMECWNVFNDAVNTSFGRLSLYTSFQWCNLKMTGDFNYLHHTPYYDFDDTRAYNYEDGYCSKCHMRNHEAKSLINCANYVRINSDTLLPEVRTLFENRATDELNSFDRNNIHQRANQ